MPFLAVTLGLSSPARAQPDLVVDSFVTPSFAFVGETMEVTLGIRNDSQNADAIGFRYAYLLSEDVIIRVFDQQVVLSRTTSIASGGTSVFIDQVRIPATFTATTTRYLGVILDVLSEVPETNENNNIAVSAPIRILVPIPELSLTLATRFLPSAIAGRPYTFSLVAVGGTGPYTWLALGGLPPGLRVTPEGRVEGSPSTPGAFQLSVRVTDDLGASVSGQVALDVVRAGASLRIQQVRIPDGVVGMPFCSDTSKFAFNATNGIEPYVWSVTGSLPPGMTFNELGELCGTPTRAGTYDFTVRAQDSTGLFGSALFRVTIEGGDPCSIATFTLPNGRVDQPYLASRPDEAERPVNLSFDSCTAPVTWSVVAGDLPLGVQLVDGTFSGTPTAVGVFAFVVRVVDATGSSSIQSLSIEVEDPSPLFAAEPSGCTCGSKPSPSWTLAWLVLLAGLAMICRRCPLDRSPPCSRA